MLTHLDRLLLAVLLLVVGKSLAVLAVAFAARNSLDVALRTAAQLAQGGEFGLVLIGLALDLKLIGIDVFQVTLAAMLLSMFLAPFLIEHMARLGGQMARGDWAHKAMAIHDIAVAGFALEDHVIICGYGRTGQTHRRVPCPRGHRLSGARSRPATSEGRRPGRQPGGLRQRRPQGSHAGRRPGTGTGGGGRLPRRPFRRAGAAPGARPPGRTSRSSSARRTRARSTSSRRPERPR